MELSYNLAVVVVLCLSFLASDTSAADPQAGHCSMYGQCGTTNCAYSGPAKPLQNSEAYHLLSNICPKLIKPGTLVNGTITNNTLTCCNVDQMHSLQTRLQEAVSMLARCPSCLHNFYEMWCQFTCNPDQQTFVQAQDFGSGQVFSTDYYVTSEFYNGIFDSCHNVRYPGNNNKVMDVMCGNGGTCNAKNFYGFIGSRQNAPFQINFIESNATSAQGHTPLDYPVTSCNSSFYDPLAHSNQSACSCQDCISSCAVPPEIPPTPKKPHILGMTVYVFTVTLVYLGFVLMFLIASFISIICGRKARSASVKAKVMTTYGSTTDSMQSEHQQATYSGSDSKHGFLTRCGVSMEKILQNSFQRWGTWAAYHPWLVIIASLVVVGALSSGMTMFKVITSPVDLWSAPDSVARQQKNYYDENFAPFYRSEQVIITKKNKTYRNDTYVGYNKPPVSFTGLIHKDILHQILDLQLELMDIVAPYNDNGKEVNVTLKDICFMPLAPHTQECTVMSVLEYWQNNHTKLDECVDDLSRPCAPKRNNASDWHDQFIACSANPTSLEGDYFMKIPCMGTFGGPVNPMVALGGFDKTDYHSATAILLTFIVKNSLSEEHNKKAEAWEKIFLEKVKAWNTDDNELIASYSSERSIQDELNRESSSDVSTILISYFLMFAYISIALGQFTECRRLLVDSKITVGLSGVLIVLASVFASLGVFSFAGVPATLIIVEVVPFLVLAVGVDNIFILVQTFQRDTLLPTEETPQQIGRVLGKVAPSMLLTSISESVAFALGGALSTMPAVRVFSQYAALAVFVDFLLQITCFIAVLALDAKRQKSNRLDIACCIKMSKTNDNGNSEGLLYQLMKYGVAPLLTFDWARIIVVVIFSGCLAFSIAVIPSVDVGLDQTLSFPKDSYLLDYFRDLNAYLHTGPPVYFVIKDGYKYENRTEQNKICGFAGCDADSMTSQIFFASEISSYSKIALPSSSWVDDYTDWLDPRNTCCRELDYIEQNTTVKRCHRVNDTSLNVTQPWTVSACKDVIVGKKIYPTEPTFCNSSVTNTSWHCSACRQLNETGKRPTQQEFTNYLPWFLSDVPTKICSKGGLGAYGAAVNLNPSKKPSIVTTSYFMSYHTILTNSSEFTKGLKQARALSERISKELGHEVFPYSVFYVFYEQYLTIAHDTWVDLVICAAAIFLVTFILLGFNIGIALIVTLTVAMIVVDMFGVMYLWDISLNAVSLVNLIMAVGISVEFCSHIARAFSISPFATRKARARDALTRTGSSVLSGITLTKFVGIVVLAFSKSQLFEVFYFRMYLGIVLVGATHGLIFLPVLLSYVGPKSRSEQTLEENEETKHLLASST